MDLQGESLSKWGPSGEVVYNRTYSRTKPDGSKETWPETVNRVARGNVSLIEDRHGFDLSEAEDLRKLIEDFKIIPAGRHLWASGVKGRQFLFNCHVSGWGDKPSDHFEFSFMRLMEGGGVGANYSMDLLERYPAVEREPKVHIVCDPMHRDYEEMKAAGLLSDYFSPDYQGAYFEVEDSREGWASALVDLIESAYTSEGSSVRVYDVSRVRCKGSRIKTFGGTASGPEPLARMLRTVEGVFSDLKGWKMNGLDAMDIDHAIAQCVVSGGNRRSARMAIMNWADPYINDFLKCKSDTNKHWTTNISVEVDEKFFAALKNPNPCWAKDLLKVLSEGMLKNGEPGIWNAALNNFGEFTRVRASNPCGEIALNEWENCNLGHINLDAFVKKDFGVAYFDSRSAAEAVRAITRFLIRATFGDVTDPKQAAILARNRRIGVGFFGYQAMCVKFGIRFSKSHEDPYIYEILYNLRKAVEEEAQTYCHQLRIPVPVKLTTVAPTGTIAKMPGTTEGLHPVYAKYFIRRIRFSTIKPEEVEQFEALKAQGLEWEEAINEPNTVIIKIPTMEKLVQEVIDLGHDPEIVESADEISLDDMFAVQAFIQRVWADNAVSFTANVEAGKYTPDELAALLEKWLPELKGTTIFPDISRPQSPYERITKAEYEAMTGPKAVEDSIDEECASGACPIR